LPNLFVKIGDTVSAADTYVCTVYTVGHKKHTKMCFTITFINSADFEEIWRIASEINFPQSSANNYHLTQVPASHYLVKLESH